MSKLPLLFKIEIATSGVTMSVNDLVCHLKSISLSGLSLNRSCIFMHGRIYGEKSPAYSLIEADIIKKLSPFQNLMRVHLEDNNVNANIEAAIDNCTQSRFKSFLYQMVSRKGTPPLDLGFTSSTHM